MPTPHQSRASRPPPTTAPTGSTESLPVSATIAGFDGVPLATITRYSRPGEVDRAQAVVAVVGDIDGDTAPALSTALTLAITSHSRVCCDLSGADFFGAAGANTLLTAHRQAAAAGCEFIVRGVHGIAYWTLTVTGLDQVLSMPEGGPMRAGEGL